MEQNTERNTREIASSSEDGPLPINMQLFSSSASSSIQTNDNDALSTSLANGITSAGNLQDGKSSKFPSWKDLQPSIIDLSNFQGLVCVHFDPLVLTLPESYAEAIGTLEFKHFGNNLENGREYINQSKSARIFLISSGGLGAQIVPQVHDLPQVYAIYIHCEDVDGHKKWAKQYSKVHVVCFNDKRDLLPVLATDAARCHSDWGDAFMKAGDTEKAIKRYKKAIEKLNKGANDAEMRKMIESKLESLKK